MADADVDLMEQRNSMALPLEGIRVLDISGTVATGYCGKLFADHGADVINVEPPAGFPTRQLAPFVREAPAPECSAMHSWLSANKASVVLDWTQQDGRDRLLSLVRAADVVLDGEAPGTLDAHGLGLERLGDARPGIVLSSVTWFGQHGPYHTLTATDAVCQALAGLLRGIGTVEGPPLLPTGCQAQIVGGLTAFIGTMAQVLAAELGTRDGAVRLDTSIHEANLCFTEVGAVATHTLARPVPRMGINRFPPTYPLGIYPCRDGWIGVTALTPAQWLGLCELLDMPDEARREDYLAVRNRLADAARLDAVIAERVKDASVDALFHRGQALRVPLAPVPTMEQLTGVDQYVERGAFGPVSHPDQGTFTAPRTPFRLFRTPAHARGRVARLGEDTHDVLARHEGTR
jgi:crotonobetainyl-CoA:carnitine CoA-transferase CaiB-like acyl-CoA transferase